MENRAEYSWDLGSLKTSTYALVILNQPFDSEKRIVDLWNGANYRVTVDGGSNQWIDIVQSTSLEINHPLPDLVTGDFDSIRPEVEDLYAKQPSVKVIKTPDQDYTDFTKALIEVESSKVSVDFVFAFVENRGRLDQILANIETLFHASNHLGSKKTLFLFGSDTVTWLLRPGKHTVAVPGDLDREKCHVGLIPIGEPVSGVVTQGLKWDLDGTLELAFGKLVSTSNAFSSESDTVQIVTPKPLLYTLEY